MVEAGQARRLLFLSRERDPAFPNVPSLTDEGILPTVDPGFPYGIGGPKGMDPNVVKILHDGFKEASDSAEVAEVLRRVDLVPLYMGSDDYTRFALAQIPEYRKLIGALGLSAK